MKYWAEISVSICSHFAVNRSDIARGCAIKSRNPPFSTYGGRSVLELLRRAGLFLTPLKKSSVIQYRTSENDQIDFTRDCIRV